MGMIAECVCRMHSYYTMLYTILYTILYTVNIVFCQSVHSGTKSTRIVNSGTGPSTEVYIKVYQRPPAQNGMGGSSVQRSASSAVGGRRASNLVRKRSQMPGIMVSQPEEEGRKTEDIVYHTVHM